MVYAFMLTALSGLSTTLGAFIIFFKITNEQRNKFITFSLSISIATMLGISITELVPESIIFIIYKSGLPKGILEIIIISLLSFIFIKIISNIINKSNIESNLYKLGILNMIALILHNLPEGIITFMSSYTDKSLGLKLSISIMLHNIPEGISIAVPIFFATKSKVKAFSYAFLSGLAELFGAIVTFLFLERYISNELLNKSLLIVGIIMITISINDLFPKVVSYKENKTLKKGLFIGILLTIFCLLIF